MADGDKGVFGGGDTCQNLTVSDKVTYEEGGIESTIGIPVAINVLIFVCCTTFLLCLVRWRRAKHVFLPKTAQQQGKDYKVAPWEWFRDAYSVDMEEAISIDGRIVVRLCLLGIKFSAAGVLGGAVITPIYAVEGDSGVKGASRFSASNFDQSDPHFVWLLVTAAYYFTAVFVWLIRAEWRYFVMMRQRHFARRAAGDFGAGPAQAACSLLLENVPPHFDSSAAVRGFLSKLFVEDNTHSCVLHRDTAILYSLASMKAKSQKVTGLCKCWQKGIDKQLERIVKIQTEVLQRAMQSTDTLQGLAMDGQVQIEEIASIFANNQTRAMATNSEQEPGADLKPTTTAFVTLQRVTDRVVFEQALLFSLATQEHARDWTVMAAPEPRDVLWKNIGVPYTQVSRFSKLGSMLCVFALLLWSVPVTGIQAMASKENLNNWFPKQVKWLSSHMPAFYNLLTQYLPVLALMALIILLPYALRFLSVRFEMRKTKTEISRVVMQRNFFFQFFSLWLTVFTGSLWETFRQIIEQPGCSAEILGKSVPGVSFYFLSFVIARIGTSLPLLLLRLPAVLSLFSSQTPAPAYCVFETEVTNIAIIFVLGSMYCVVAPLLMPACLIYFSLAWLIYKWLFVHVYEIEYDLKGELWYPIFDGLCVGMLFGMLSVCGMASVTVLKSNGSFYVIWAMWLIPIALILFRRDCHKKFGVMSRFMPLEDAVSLDRGGQVKVDEFKDNFYLDPMLKGEDPDQTPQRQLTPTEEEGDESSLEEGTRTTSTSDSESQEDHRQVPNEADGCLASSSRRSPANNVPASPGGRSPGQPGQPSTTRTTSNRSNHSARSGEGGLHHFRT